MGPHQQFNMMQELLSTGPPHILRWQWRVRAGSRGLRGVFYSRSWELWCLRFGRPAMGVLGFHSNVMAFAWKSTSSFDSDRWMMPKTIDQNRAWARWSLGHWHCWDLAATAATDRQGENPWGCGWLCNQHPSIDNPVLGRCYFTWIHVVWLHVYIYIWLYVYTYNWYLKCHHKLSYTWRATGLAAEIAAVAGFGINTLNWGGRGESELGTWAAKLTASFWNDLYDVHHAWPHFLSLSLSPYKHTISPTVYV